MNKIFPLLRLIRLQNCLIAAIAVWLGGYLADIAIQSTNLILASIAVALACGAGNALNDFLDIEIDRKNHPGRPLPQNQLPAYLAILVSLTFSLTAIAISAFINFYLIILILSTLILLLAYNLHFKRQFVSGNIIVSFLAGLALIMGALAEGNYPLLKFPGPAVPALFAFLLHLGREWIKDKADLPGDLAADYKTVPARLSSGAMIGLICLLYVVLIIVTLIPIFLEWYTIFYSYLVIFGFDIPLVILLIYLIFGKSGDKFKITGRWVKILMLIGLIAFWFGKK